MRTNKSVALLAIVEGIAKEGHVKQFAQQVHPYLRKHAQRYAVGRFRNNDPESSDLHITMAPREKTSVHGLIKELNRHIPIASTPNMEPRRATVLFQQSNPHRQIQVDFQHKGQKDFDDHVKDNDRDYDFMDDDTQKLLSGTKKSKKGPDERSFSYNIKRRYKLS